MNRDREGWNVTCGTSPVLRMPVTPVLGDVGGLLAQCWDPLGSHIQSFMAQWTTQIYMPLKFSFSQKIDILIRQYLNYMSELLSKLLKTIIGQC